jgi:hypothetical protein
MGGGIGTSFEAWSRAGAEGAIEGGAALRWEQRIGPDPRGGREPAGRDELAV